MSPRVKRLGLVGIFLFALKGLLWVALAATGAALTVH